MVEAPALAHAADRVGGAEDAEQEWEGQEGVRVEMGKAGHWRGDGQTAQDDDGAPGEGAEARVEEGRGHVAGTKMQGGACVAAALPSLAPEPSANLRVSRLGWVMLMPLEREMATLMARLAALGHRAAAGG